MTELIQLIPVMMFTILAFQHPETLYGTIFLFPAGGSLIVGLTWRSAYPTTAGLGVSLLLFGFSFFCLVCFAKVLVERLRGHIATPSDDEEGE
jgi:amino acid transporter